MQQVHHFYGGIDHWHDWISRYDSITADEVRAAVNRWLVVPSHLTIDVKPQNSAHPTNSAARPHHSSALPA